MPIVPMSVPIASVGIVIPTVIVSILLGLVAGLAVLFIAIARTRSGGSVPADDRLMTAMGHLSGYGGYEYEAQNGDAGGGGYAGGGGFLSQSGASQGDKGEKKVRRRRRPRRCARARRAAAAPHPESP